MQQEPSHQAPSSDETVGGRVASHLDHTRTTEDLADAYCDRWSEAEVADRSAILCGV